MDIKENFTGTFIQKMI